MKREFVMLCQKYNPKKHFINSWYVSEKLDGIRAIWDGGLSRDLFCDVVPWANVAKDGRLLERPIATGLWTRLGKVIQAPKWFLDSLPNLPLDGELHAPSGSWQTLSSTIKKFKPYDEDWKTVVYSVFDSPPLDKLFGDGEINITNFKKTFSNIQPWIQKRSLEVGLKPFTGEKTFDFVYEKLKLRIQNNNIIKVHPQIELPRNNYQEVFDAKFEEVVAKGGEGLVIRAPHSIWTPERSHMLLKYKPFQDDEGIVIGYIWGKKTDKGSKLLGLMGALILNYKGKRLELSGFTEDEREMIDNNNSKEEAFNEGVKHPGEEVNINLFKNPIFPIGNTVTFRYRELSDTGTPKEARFLRKPI
jgi:DNA ligase-1